MLQGAIVDQGSYHDLMAKSMILRDLVHSVGNTSKEQYQRQTSDLSECEAVFVRMFIADISESQKSLSPTPSQLSLNRFQTMESVDQEQPELQSVSIDMEVEKKDTVQKEHIHTGSVSSMFSQCILYDDSEIWMNHTRSKWMYF